MATPENLESDRDGLAAELVLGTLDEIELVVARELLASDASFVREVRRWQWRLDPLLDVIPDLTPPVTAREAVLAAINRPAVVASYDRPKRAQGAETAATVNVIDLSGRVRFWRRSAIAATALAASLAGFVAFREFRPSAENQFVAVLENAERRPAFVASVDVAQRTIAIKKLAPSAGEGKSYELWAIEGKAAPVSLGLVDETVGFGKNRPIGATVAGSGPALTLAVTVEPQGGSPTGQPSSTPVYVGTLVQAPGR